MEGYNMELTPLIAYTDWKYPLFIPVLEMEATGIEQPHSVHIIHHEHKVGFCALRLLRTGWAEEGLF